MVKISKKITVKAVVIYLAWMGIVFPWRFRVYAFRHETCALDGSAARMCFDFDRRSGVALARVTNYLPANSRRRLHFPKSPLLTSLFIPAPAS
jgi:hypothetical protein